MGKFNFQDAVSSIRALLDRNVPRAAMDPVGELRAAEDWLLDRHVPRAAMDPVGELRAAEDWLLGRTRSRADDNPLLRASDDESLLQRHADTRRRSGVYYVDPAGNASGRLRPDDLDSLDVPPVAAEPDFALDSPLFRDMYKADMAYDNLRKGRTRNLRNAGGELAAIAQDNIRTAAQRSKRAGSRLAPAAAVAGAGAGLGLMLAPKNLGLTESGNPADLRDAPESASDILSRPEFPLVPQEDIRIPKKHFYDMDGRPFDESVRGGRPEAELMQPVAQPADYSMQARELIDKLNAMRRAASPGVLRANGGDVPGAQVIMREIDRLLELGNQTRRATYVAAPRDEAGRLYQQAQGLIDQVNQLQSQGYPHGSPQVQRLMTQVRQLQSQGDAIRNRRAG